jgi:hypothetical protein
MSNKTFIADINAWAEKSEREWLRLARQSIDDTVRIAQTPIAKGGFMPVDTGTLRNSLIVELNGTQVAAGGDSYTLGIAGLKLGDVLSVAWTADYAIPRHYMNPAFGQGPGLWRDKAAVQWQDIVRKNARAGT